MRGGRSEPRPQTSADAVFLYDGECGFCRASAEFLRERVSPRRVDIRPFQETDLAALGVTEEQCRAAAALVTVDASGAAAPAGPAGSGVLPGSRGSAASMPPRFGAQAIAGALRRGRLAWPLVGVALQAPGVRALARVVYAWVARNRHRLRLRRPV